MSKILDGLNFTVPPSRDEIVALAHYHREKLNEAITHQETRMGDFCLAQRQRVCDFTRELNADQRAEFYQIYNHELVRIANKDRAHLEPTEAGVSIFAIVIVLAVIALILFFAFIRGTVV